MAPTLTEPNSQAISAHLGHSEAISSARVDGAGGGHEQPGGEPAPPVLGHHSVQRLWTCRGHVTDVSRTGPAAKRLQRRHVHRERVRHGDDAQRVRTDAEHVQGAPAGESAAESRWHVACRRRALHWLLHERACAALARA